MADCVLGEKRGTKESFHPIAETRSTGKPCFVEEKKKKSKSESPFTPESELCGLMAYCGLMPQVNLMINNMEAATTGRPVSPLHWVRMAHLLSWRGIQIPIPLTR